MVSPAVVWPSTASHAEDHGSWLHLIGFNCTHVLSANYCHPTSAQFCEYMSVCTNVLAADAHVPRRAWHDMPAVLSNTVFRNYCMRWPEPPAMGSLGAV